MPRIRLIAYFQFAFLFLTILLWNLDEQIAIESCKYSIVINLMLGFYCFKVSYQNWINPHNLFLFSVFFFLTPRIFLDVLGYEPFNATVFYSSYHFSFYTSFKILININIAIISFLLGSNFERITIKKNKEVDENLNLLKIGKRLFIIGFPIVLYKLIVTIYILATEGYRALNLGNVSVPDSFIISLFSICCFFGYFIFLISKPDKKQNILIIVSTLFLFLVLIADGRRGPAFSFILVVLWFVFYSRGIKLNLRKIITYGVFGLSIAIIMGYFRNSKEITSESFDFTLFFYSQGVSIQVIGYTIDFVDQLNYNFVDLFGNIRRYFDVNFFGSNSSNVFISRAREYKIFSNYISDTVNRDLYYRGLGIGGSYIAQLYAVAGEIGQLLGGVFIGFSFTRWINVALNSKFWGKVILLLYLPYIIYIPRDNLFDFITDNLLFTIILASIYIINNLRKRIKIEMSK